MQLTFSILSEPLITALGWTVLHSLWQAALVALLLLPVHWSLRRRPARWRYLLALAALFIICLMSVFTFARIYAPAAPATVADGPVMTTTILLPEVSKEGDIYGLETFFQRQLPLLVTLWLIGLLFFSFRLLGGLMYLNFLRRNRVFALPASWQDRLTEMKQQMGIQRDVQWMESARVQSPVLIGWLKPLILFPLGAVNRLSPEEVEAILAHELAHVRRHDFLIQLVQSIIETLYYFNPAVWWISGLIRTEREHICDDMAIAHSQGSLQYARALLRLEEWQQPAPALALGFFGHRPILLHRIRRILRQPQPQRQVRERLLATLLLLATGLLVGMSQSAGTERTVPEPVRMPVSWQGAATGVPAADTLPDETARYKFNRDGQVIDARVVDGQIRELTVDGLQVPPSEYPAWENKLGRWIAEIPEPQRSPLAPAPPEAPGTLGIPSPPPSPPAPPAPETPAPDLFGKDASIRIETIKRDDGSLEMTLKREGRLDTILRFNPGEDLRLFLDDLEVIAGDEFDFRLDEHVFPENAPKDPGPHAPFFEFDQWEDLAEDQQEELREAMQEKREEMREAMEEYRQAQREAMEEYREAQRKAQEEYREAMEEMRRARQEAHAARREAQRKALREQRRQRDERQRRLEDELLRDGLIDDARNYKLDLNEKYLKVNGKKQPEELYRKYRELLGADGDVLIKKSSN